MTVLDWWCPTFIPDLIGDPNEEPNVYSEHHKSDEYVWDEWMIHTNTSEMRGGVGWKDISVHTPLDPSALFLPATTEEHFGALPHEN